jgi:cytochrome d ubiquinol oxidase subunit II
MAELVASALVLSLVIYAVLGGADFGAGLIEPFLARAERKQIDVAIAPVWEANHVWLVLAVVLAFVGFPAVYVAASTYLHIPLSLVLVGILGRGAAFTFRHYDPDAGALGGFYSWAFRISSALSPFFLGVTLAALVNGRLTTTLERGFFAVFMAPWLSPFCLATGLFTVCLFAFEGAALLAAEHPQAGRLPHLNVARVTQLLTVLSGGLVFVAAAHDGVPLWQNALERPYALIALVVASTFVPVLAWGFHRGTPTAVRLSLGAQALAILVGFFATQAPVFVHFQDAENLTLQNSAAPDATLRSLLVALAIGLLFIVPAMAVLMLVYKGRPNDVNGSTRT